MTSLEKLFNEGLIRSEHKRQMILAYEEFLRRKKNYYALISERARKTWDRRQKERISDEL
jgi:predicted GIY-YIG superfamily endonuclease